jgi:hypothetical protein
VAEEKFNQPDESKREKFQTPTDDGDDVEAHKFEPTDEKFADAGDDDDVEAHKF